MEKWPVIALTCGMLDIRAVTVDVPPQDVITKDNVTLNVNAVVSFRLLTQKDAVVNVEDASSVTISIYSLHVHIAWHGCKALIWFAWQAIVPKALIKPHSANFWGTRYPNRQTF